MPTGYLTRIVEFTATHRFPDPPEFAGATSDHSHRYRCAVTVKGVFDPARGGVMSLPVLKSLLQHEVVARFDGRHINEDIAPFAGGRGLALCAYRGESQSLLRIPRRIISLATAPVACGPTPRWSRSGPSGSR